MKSFAIDILQEPTAELMEDLKSVFASNPYHSISLHPVWSVILSKSFGTQPYVLRARSSGRTCGYLCLQLVESLLFGKFLVSQPYLNYGGVVASDPECQTMLIEEAYALADRLQVKHLELRSAVPPEGVPQSLLATRKLNKVNATLALPSNKDLLWQGFSPKVRNQIRKAQQGNLKVAWGGDTLLDDFYRVFAQNMRDLGTPVYSKKLFSNILTHLPQLSQQAGQQEGHAEICVIRDDERCLAAGLVVSSSTGSEVLSASSLRAYNHLNANMLLYYEMLNRAVDANHRGFDFGRATIGEGCYQFKKNWRVEFTPADWQFAVFKGDPSALRRQNPKFKYMTRVWQKMPVGLANIIGPHIVRGIP